MEILNNLTNLSGEIFDIIKGLLYKFNTYFLQFFNTIINGKHYKYYSALLLISVLVFIYFLVYSFNPFNIIKSKYEQLGTLLFMGIFIFIFFFLVYRKTIDNTHYNDKLEIVNKQKGKLLKENYKNTLKNPILKLLKYFFSSLLFIIIPILIIVGLFWLYNNFENMFFITKFTLGIFISITTLAIIAKLFSIKADDKTDNCINQNGLSKIFCIIKNFIFFLPCLLVIITDEFHKDIKLTPSSVYILFIVELILICLIFLLPTLFKMINSLNKNNVLGGKGPFYLNERKEIGNYQNLSNNYSGNIAIKSNTQNFDKKKSKSEINMANVLNTLRIDDTEIKNFETNLKNNIKQDTNKIHNFNLFKKSPDTPVNIESSYNTNRVLNMNKIPYNYTYSISFYLYLNPQPPNTSIAYTRDAELFNYGNKPVVYYNGKSRKIIIKSRTLKNEGDQLDTIYSTDTFKYQKWLFFVINYDNGIIDVFIDGKLVGSKKNVPPYFKGDKVTLGEDNGIHGSIKEIYYHNKTRPVSDVEFLYDLTKN